MTGSAPSFAAALDLYESGRLGDAEAVLDRLLAEQPDHAPGLHLLGVIALRTGRIDRAIDRIIQAIRIDEGVARYHSHLGNALRLRGWPDKALACYRRALELRPDYPEATNNLGAALQDLGRIEEGAECHRRALEMKPDYPDALTNLGTALQELGRPQEAVVHHLAALSQDPEEAAFHNNLGTALQALGQIEAARESFERAVSLRPDYHEALTNLGNAHKDLGRLELALDHHQRALALVPDFADARWNRALAWLQLGDFARGWPEYDWRWLRRAKGQERWRPFPQPLWSGEAAPAGGTIFVWAEQGFGDCLHFARYAPLLAKMGWRVILEAPPPLARLFSSLGEVSVIARGEQPPPFDVHCPLLGLPRAFATTMETIPAAIPYLSAQPGRAEEWGRRLSERPGLKLGICWRGRPTNKRDRLRSLAAEAFAGLLDLPGLAVVSLQKDGRPDELAALGHPLDAGPELGDYADTAALVAGLDLVISVDTSVCHLAGALGMPTWTLLEFAPDWRWLLGRDDSPWYPSMRLFRQPAPGEWPAVIARVRDALRQRIGTPPGQK